MPGTDQIPVAPRAGKRGAAEIFTASDEHLVVIADSGAAGLVLAQLEPCSRNRELPREKLLIQEEAQEETHPYQACPMKIAQI